MSELEPLSTRFLLNSNAWSSCFSKETTDAFPECNFSILDTRVFSKAVMASRSSWRSFSIICSAAWETWRLAVVIFVSSSCYVLSKSQITSRADLLLLFDQLRCGNDVCFSSSTAFQAKQHRGSCDQRRCKIDTLSFDSLRRKTLFYFFHMILNGAKWLSFNKVS